MQIKFGDVFTKQYDKAPTKVRKAFDERLTLFCANKHHPLLNNHQLLGKYQDCRSINITGDWRAIYRDFDSDETVYFITLGTHSQLYK